VLTIVGTVRSEFRYVWLYEVGGQGIIIASNSASAIPRAAYIERIAEAGTTGPLFALYGASIRGLPDKQLLDPAGIDRLIAGFGVPAGFWVSTDDNLTLEYSTPRGNTLDAAESFRANLNGLRGAAVPVAH
jgi:hypothetical protein